MEWRCGEQCDCFFARLRDDARDMCMADGDVSRYVDFGQKCRFSLLMLDAMLSDEVAAIDRHQRAADRLVATIAARRKAEVQP